MRASRPGLTATLLAFVLFGGCQTMPERHVAERTAASVEFPAAVYRQAASGPGKVFTLDPKQSSIRIYIYRSGPLAAQGHNHIVTADDFQGAVYLPDSGLNGARFDIVVPLQALDVDPAAVRREVGGNFASEPDAQARQGTRDNMLGPAVLDAARYPRLGIRSVAIAGDLPKLIATIALTMRGVTREQTVPLDIQLAPGRLVASNALVVNQRDFGIQPFSALGGLLQVQDPLLIEFSLVGIANR